MTDSHQGVWAIAGIQLSRNLISCDSIRQTLSLPMEETGFLSLMHLLHAFHERSIAKCVQHHRICS